MGNRVYNQSCIKYFIWAWFFIIITVFFGTAPSECSESTVYVDPQYNSSTPGWNITHFASIQSAILGVANSGTVTVRPGTYYENIIIEKPVRLIGETTHTALVDGQGKGYTIDIRSADVEVIDLKITNEGAFENWAVNVTGPGSTIINNNYILDIGISLGTNNCTVTNNRIFGEGSIFLSGAWNNLVQNNHIEALYPGSIWLMGGSNNNTISNNTIIGDKEDASCTGIRSVMSHNNLYSNNLLNNFRVHILLSCSNGNILINNTITGDRGWEDEAGGGIVLYRSSDNWVSSNDISSVLDGGISLWGPAIENQIQANNIKGTDRGIELYFGANKNIIVNNEISNCNFGFRIFASNNNQINKNNLINNNTQAFDNGNNIWSDAGQGNYWSNYKGTDSNGDGVGDISHPIPKGKTDPAPLISPTSIISPEQPALAPLDYVDESTQDINISNNVDWKNENKEVSSTHIIHNNGQLTIDQTIVDINDFGHFVFIEVKAGGTLKIQNSTINSNGCCIWANKNSNLYIENSVLNGLGVWDGDGAVQVGCDNAIIINNVFNGGYSGVNFYEGASNIQFVGNVIRNVRVGLFICCELSQNNLVESNTFENIIEHAIFDLGGIGDNRIVDNKFKNVWQQVLLLPDFGHDNIIKNNSFEYCPPYTETNNDSNGSSGGCYIRILN